MNGGNVGVVNVPLREVQDVLPLLLELRGISALGLQTLDDDIQRLQPLLQPCRLPLVLLLALFTQGKELVPERTAGDLAFGDWFPQDFGQLPRRLADAVLLEFPAVLGEVPRPR